jgi:peptide/nickel transport system substrate-binding protein
VPDGTVRLTALKTGDAGFVQLIPLESLAELQAAPSKDYVVRTVKGGGGFSAILLNSRKPPFNDVRVRRAVALATDKKEVGLGVWRGFAQPVNQWMPPGTPWFFAVPDRKADVEQAKKLLAEAGFARGTKLTHTVGQVANLVPAAQVFQAQLTRIGIDLQLEVLDWPAYIKRQRAMDFTSTNTNFGRVPTGVEIEKWRILPVGCPTTNRPPARAASGGMRHGARYQRPAAPAAA